MVILKRIYDQPAKSDGCRVLVDRLWPRGVSKQAAALDRWLKEIGPSPDLRTWFNHEPAKFSEFKAAYLQELVNNPQTAELIDLARTRPQLTLLYGAKDPAFNQAVVIKEFIDKRLEQLSG